jgi:TonB family protein
MNAMRATAAAALAVTLCLLAATRMMAASDELNRAKELYRSASYDEALKALDSIPPSVAIDEAVELNQFRVLCLVALDRRDDAKRAMAALITASPSYQLSEEDASPRVRAMFTEVRKSVFPSIVQKAYADAKAAFDRKDPAATSRFDRVLTLLEDPDIATDPAFADLATVVKGFRDLSVAATAAPPPVLTAAPALAAVPAGGGTVARPAPAGAGAILAPIAISQALPPMPLRDQREWDGEVEVVIDAAGKVVAARMTKSIHPVYDAAVLRTAKTWTYKPGTRDGAPAEMKKLVTIHIDARPACSGRVTVNCRPANE